MNQIVDSVLDWIFPASCMGCGRIGSYVCSHCLNKLKAATPKCPGCSKPSPYGLTHPKCRTLTPLLGAVAAFSYTGLGLHLIQRFKYHGLTHSAETLAELVVTLADLSPIRDLDEYHLTYAPIHTSKQRTRGYNQSELVAKKLSGLLSMSCIPLLIKTKPTETQTHLDRAGRLTNLSHSIEAVPIKPFPSHLILFDDVMTTGATLTTGAKALKRAGATHIWGLTIAT